MTFHHPADDRGSLIPPARPKREPARMTLEEELAAAEAFMRRFDVPEEQIEQGLALIRQAHEGG